MCAWDGDAGNIQGLSGLSTQFCHEPKTAGKKKLKSSKAKFLGESPFIVSVVPSSSDSR